MASVLDLASLNEVGVQTVLDAMNNLQRRKWIKKNVPSKLASYLSAAIDEANSKGTVSEWLAALSLSESGAAEWLNDEGPYEEEEEKTSVDCSNEKKERW